MELFRQAEFQDNTQFLIVDKLIHGCTNKQRKRKLMAKGKDMSVKDCLEVMQRFEVVEVTMKKLKDSGDTHVNASHTHDPTKKLQRNGSKEKHFNLQSQQESKKSD